MIHGKYIGQGEDLTIIKQLREQIFDPSYDLREDLDPMALNAIVDVDGKPIGVGRLVLDLIEDRFYVDNIGILKEARGKQYGDFTLRMLADKANQCAATEIWAEVPEPAKGFFETHFFEPVGTNGDLALMNAGIVKFHSCCSHGQADAECSGKDCASCGGCKLPN